MADDGKVAVRDDMEAASEAAPPPRWRLTGTQVGAIVVLLVGSVAAVCLAVGLWPEPVTESPTWAPTQAPTALPALAPAPLEVVASDYAFAAIKIADGSAIAWGPPEFGGNASTVASLLTEGVDRIVAGKAAFVALKGDRAVAWGDIESAPAELSSGGVLDVVPFDDSFAAVTSSGEVVMWGNSSDSTAATALRGAKSLEIVGGEGSFAARTETGKVVTWGPLARDGPLKGVAEVLASVKAGLFVARMESGDVVTWGRPGPANAEGVFARRAKKVVVNNNAVAALSEDGVVTARGSTEVGGNLTVVAERCAEVCKSPLLLSFYMNGTFVEVDDIVAFGVGMGVVHDGWVHVWSDPRREIDPFWREGVSSETLLVEGENVLLYSVNQFYRSMGHNFYFSTFTDAGARSLRSADLSRSPRERRVGDVVLLEKEFYMPDYAFLVAQPGAEGANVYTHDFGPGRFGYVWNEGPTETKMHPLGRSGMTVALVGCRDAVTAVNLDGRFFTFSDRGYFEHGSIDGQVPPAE